MATLTHFCSSQSLRWPRNVILVSTTSLTLSCQEFILRQIVWIRYIFVKILWENSNITVYLETFTLYLVSTTTLTLLCQECILRQTVWTWYSFKIPWENIDITVYLETFRLRLNKFLSNNWSKYAFLRNITSKLSKAFFMTMGINGLIRIVFAKSKLIKSWFIYFTICISSHAN